MPKTFLIILIIVGLALPIFALAQLGGPIVPCRDNCTLCDIFRMMQTIINYIGIAIFVIATIFVGVGGVIMLTSAGSPDKVGHGKAMITNAIIGIVIALLSWVIINEVLIAVSGSMADERIGKVTINDIDWPWNQIQCVGGGITSYGYQDSSYRCYNDLNSCNSEGVGGCAACTSDCIDGTDCTGGTTPPAEQRMCTCGANSALGNRLYNTAAECSSQCNSYCNINYSGAPGCCGTDVYLNGCSGQAVNRCDQRSVAGYCFNNNYYCLIGVRDQVAYSAGELDSLLDCMAPRLPSGDARNISSVTDNSGGRCVTNWTSPQCSGSTDSCTGTCCAHEQYSLHYGGRNCRGTSYAVDFASESAYTYIHDAAAACASSLGLGQVDVLNEGNHVHVELDGFARTMGCI